MILSVYSSTWARGKHSVCASYCDNYYSYHDCPQHQAQCLVNSVLSINFYWAELSKPWCVYFGLPPTFLLAS
jgi:hypothetical protein